MKKVLLTVLMLFMFVGCSSSVENAANNEVEDNQIESGEEDNEETNSFDAISAIYSADETYIEKGTKLGCIIETDIRMRDNPNGNLITEEYNGQQYNSHIPMQCYKVNDTVNDENYSWLNVDIENPYMYYNGTTNVWVGTTSEWLTYRISGDDDCKYELDERKLYQARGTHSLALSDNIWYSKNNLDGYFEMDDKGYDICIFLCKTMPGLNWSTEGYYVNFDSRNPSEEAKQSILSQIAKYGIVGYYIKDDKETFKNIYDKFYTIELLNLAKYGDDLASYFGNQINKSKEQLAEDAANSKRLYLREHIDYYTEKTYGTKIDFTTATVYDCEEQLYVLNSAHWGSTSNQIPFVLDYKEEKNTITVNVALVEIDGDSFIVTKDSGISDQSLFNDYILNKAPKCVCVLNVEPDGNYQLITSQLINQ